MTTHAPTDTKPLIGRKLDDLPDVLTIKELSTWAQIPVSTLYQWNFKEIGPRPMKFGKHLRYSRTEVREWMESLDRHHWSQASQQSARRLWAYQR